jgi:tetratricopeptide (TPR) repeat protein
MEAERWQRIEDLYHSALLQEESRRARFLEEACGGDDALRTEVESLLKQPVESEGFLEAPALQLAAKVIAMSTTVAGGILSPPARSVPRAIGRYRIIRIVGEGGMGIVYEAEQEQPRRTVALKVIRPGLATPERLWRFQHESQALGRLQHPGIAQIYEASTADTGLGPQPYFAMEFICGRHLHEYAQDHQLDTRQKLTLITKICDAVHHAHQRGLIHRDLKPGNIIVDETGQPKILDFGVARITENDPEPTRQTELGQLVGTLSYMSPEQVLGDPLEVDTRSDVYSLGVILYELLSGRLPYDVNHRQLQEAVQTIREEDPTSLSSISRSYRGDVETIVGKALEKHKTRRYASAADLAADIRHYLKDEPITARPPSTVYHVHKFARRHRALVTSVAIVLVVLTGGVVASTWQAIRANRASQEARLERDRALAEKKRADEESATAKAINSFLQNDLLSQAGVRAQARTDAKPDRDLKVRTALDRAAVRINGKFDHQPLVEASIRRTIGMTYIELGNYPEAQRQLEQAVELTRRVLGELHPDTLLTMRNLAGVYFCQSDHKHAEVLYQKVLRDQLQVLGERNPETLGSMFELAEVYSAEGKYAQAEPLMARTLEVRRSVLGGQHPDTLAAAYRLGVLYKDEGNLAQAEPLLIRSLEAQRRVQGEDHPDTLLTMTCLASLYMAEGKYGKAEPLLHSTLEIERRELGEHHRDTIFSMNNLAYLYDAQGKYAQAEPLWIRVLDFQRRSLGEQHRDTLNTMLNLALLYKEEGKYGEAEPLMNRTLEIERLVLGDEYSGTLISMNNLASLYCATGRYPKAESLFGRALDIRRRTLGEENAATLRSMNNVAEVYQLLGRYREAEALAVKTFEAQRRLFGEDNADTLDTMDGLGRLYRSEGKATLAEPLLVKALDVRRRTLGAGHPETLSVMNDLAVLRRQEGKLAEADALFTSTLESQRRVLGPAHPDTLDVMASLGEVRLDENKYADAESLAREALTFYERAASSSWQRYRSEVLLGASLAAQNRYADAERLIISGYQGLTQRVTQMPFKDRPRLEQTVGCVAHLYESWGKPEKSAEWRQRMQELPVP